MKRLVDRIEGAGFTLRTNGDRLSISHAERLSADQVQFLQDNRDEIWILIRLREIEAETETYIPWDLYRLAVRFCREIHNDSPSNVAAMLEDLANEPDALDWWRGYFRQGLSIPANVRCSECRFIEDRGNGQGLCTKDVSPPPGSLFWMTDDRSCYEFVKGGAA